MRQCFTRIKEVFFAVRLRRVWLVPVFVNLFWNPFFHLPLHAAKAAELSRNHGQKQTTSIKTPIELAVLSAGDAFLQPSIIYDGPGVKLLKIKVKADILETFQPDIDIFQNISSESVEAFSSPISSSNASDNRFEIFRLKQKLNSFNCGLEYRHIAKNLNDFSRYKNKTETRTKVGLKNDQEGVEVWGEENIGSLGIRTFFSRFSDNVDSNAALPQMLTHKYGLELKYKMGSLPIWLSLFHTREQSENNFETGGSEYQGIQKETYNGSLKYDGGKHFGFTASSSYSSSRDLFHPDQKTISLRNSIRSSIRPASHLTITPMFSFGEYRNLWDGTLEINPSASLFVTYHRIFNIVDLSFLGRHSQTSNTDQSLDNETLSSSIGLAWTSKRMFSRKINYSLNLGFNEYADNIQPDNSYRFLSASFKFEFQL
jgi:hypothetical protein